MKRTTNHRVFRQLFRIANAFRRRGVLAAAFAGLVITACDVHGPSDPGSLASITVTPSVTMSATSSQQMTAVGRDAEGRIVVISPTWSVAASGGTIGSTGIFAAGSVPGTFENTVVATVGRVSGSASITVTAGLIASISILPASAAVGVSGTQQFAAVGLDAAGNIVPFTPTWSVVAGGGTIAQTGVFTAGAASGIFTNTVQASNNGLTAFATVIVGSGSLLNIVVTPNPVTLNAGLTQQFSATGTDASGNVISITPVWTVTNGGGTIDATGRFTAGAQAGTFSNTITATSGSRSGTATVTVTNATLATITVTPNPAPLGVGAAQQFTATGRDGSGNLVAIVPVWSVVAGGGTINSATGLFTAGNTAGTFTNTVSAVAAGVTGLATVIVSAGTLATIVVTPNPASLQASGTQQFVAAGSDASGAPFLITPVWSVVNGGGSINATTGVFTAGLVPGTFTSTVRATSGNISGFATVTVSTSGAALATITVTPNPASVQTNAAQQFIAVGRSANGTVVQITPVWTVVNGGGTINAANGAFTAGTATGTFVNTVSATSGSISGTATVTVTASSPAPAADLGTAALNGIMAGTAVTCVNGGIINANVSISPGNTVTGFGPCIITGVQHLNDAIAIQNQIDLTSAYNTLAGLPCSPSNAIVANLGGTTKPAGVYCTAGGIGVTGTLTLDGGGDPNATFVFQAGSSLTTAGSVVLINGAQAKNVWWQVGSSATIGTASQWQGNIAALTSITLVDNATLRGRALARNGAVSLGTNNVIILP